MEWIDSTLDMQSPTWPTVGSTYPMSNVRFNGTAVLYGQCSPPAVVNMSKERWERDYEWDTGRLTSGRRSWCSQRVRKSPFYVPSIFLIWLNLGPEWSMDLDTQKKNPTKDMVLSECHKNLTQSPTSISN